MNKIRVIQCGIGPIGAKITQAIEQNANMKIVGAVDIDKEKAGKDLGEVTGLGKPLGVNITDDLDSLLSTIKADVAVYTTSSYM